MSQFLLLIGDCLNLQGRVNVQFRQVQDEPVFLARAAQELFQSPTEAYWTIITADTESTDILFTEAQRLMLADVAFEDTRLGQIISHLVECARSIVLWYGEDWQDLPVVDAAAIFVEQIKTQVLLPSCEVYLRFENKNLTVVH
jgi:hypothetical protein